jgi:outer membrane immunogenic protein
LELLSGDYFMRIGRSFATAAAAGAAFVPGSYAADIPMRAPAVKAPPIPPAPVWTWTGFYAGVHLGYAWQQFEASGAYLDGGVNLLRYNNKTNPAGFMGGGQIGYNWQSGMAVFGLEADFSGFAQSTPIATTILTAPNIIEQSSGKIEWLGTVRGRLGVAFGTGSLLYATGGLAYGQVNNTHIEIDPSALTGIWQERKVRYGYAVGGGWDQMFTNNWSVRVEGMYVDLGDTTLTLPTIPPCATTCQPLTFSNTAVIARAAINYRFGP